MTNQQQNSFPLHLIGLLAMMLAAAIALDAQDGKLPQDTGSNAEVFYHPITEPERGYWFIHNTIGARSLAGGAIGAGWGTWLNKPEEYGTHWEGFSKRYGLWLS